MAEPRVRPLRPADRDAVLALNRAEVPRVGPLTADDLTGLLSRCELAMVAEVAAEGLAGFLLALAPGQDYASPNYGWFAARGTDFLYVDRVVTAPAHRRRGVASRLYDAIEERARAQGRAEVTCEVNVRPANPTSLAFHRQRGYREVGRQDTSGGRLTVALLALPVGPRAGAHRTPG